MNQTYAKVILDSVNQDGKRITTVELKYWRAIHSEIMTHRDRARNAMSSRAIPFYRESTRQLTIDDIQKIGGIPIGKGQFKEISLDPNETYNYIVPNCTYAMVHNHPYMPEFIGCEKKGMQSGSELTGDERADTLFWIGVLKNQALAACKEMFDNGCHKSIINRYLEPWSYITVVMTATEWKNFFRLRIHPKAEKHFNQLAIMIRDALDQSVPTSLKNGDWHMPYIKQEDTLSERLSTCDSSNRLYYLKRISAARCARVSYLTHDGVRDIEQDLRLFEDLIHPKDDNGNEDDAIHASALEHVAQASPYNNCRSGPFNGWFQFRKEFANENVAG